MNGTGLTRANPYVGWKVLLGLAILAVLPYVRSVWLPPIADDYLQVSLARQYGRISGWPALAQDALYRCRATSLLMTHWTEQLAGYTPLMFQLTSVAVHILNTWLVLLLGSWPAFGWRTAALAAGFFAVYEGHQEAVIWYAALPELLVFTFGLASFLAWVKWLESGTAGTRWLIASFVAFLAALASKESGVLVLGLMALPALTRRGDFRKILPAAVPFAAAGAVYFGMIYASRSSHQHFSDGTFALGFHFLSTLAVSTARLFWFWGLLAVAALWFFGAKNRTRTLALGVAWVWISLLPYSFLIYMDRVPSRHTYFASAGLSLIVAAGFLAFGDRLRRPRWLPAAVVVAAVLHNAGYVWTVKHAQYVRRAEPTDAVIRALRSTGGPVWVHCFPYPFNAAELAAVVGAEKPADSVRLWKGDLATETPPPGILCLDPQAPGPHPGHAAASRY